MTTITDKAVEKIKSNNLIIGQLMAAFNKGEGTIYNWLKSKDVRLTTPTAVQIVSEATGKEIKRLRGKKVSAAQAASFIGVGVDRLRKWEERDSDPADTGDIEKVENYFGVTLAELKGLKDFDFVQIPRERDLQNKYLQSIERENKRLQTDLDLSLGELRHNALLARAVAETNQELLVEVLVSVKKLSQKDQKDLSYKVGIKNDEKYEILRSEGRFADIGR